MSSSQTHFPLDPDSLTGPLGAHHFIRYSGDGTHLLVHFANAPKGMEARLHHSALEVQARKRGWALLTVIAEDGHDFRTSDVVAFFDRCVDSEVFDGFEETLFYGDAEGGYAALCYALAAPGARVVSVTPKAPISAPNPRYALDADNLLAASQVVLLHDPTMPDAIPPVDGAELLTTRFLAPDAEARMVRFGVFWPVLEGVMTDTFEPLELFQGLRQRRDDRLYIRRLSKLCVQAGQFRRAALLLGSFGQRTGRQRFIKAHNELIETHDLKGLPKL